MGDRYRYDFKLCTPANGWAQLDTKQDAPYFGNWINPIEFKLMSYCEGDTCLTECEDIADFAAELQVCIDWHKEREYFIGIDCAGNEEIKAALVQMGFAEVLH
jgi:hypothetical protein